MKLLGLAPTKNKYHKVKIYAFQYVDIPLELVLHNMIVDWNTSEENLKLPVASLRLKNSRGEIKGIICYENLEALVDFFIKYYIPSNNFYIDHLLKSSKRLSKNKRKNLILETLIREESINSPGNNILSRSYIKRFGPSTVLMPAVAISSFSTPDRAILRWQNACGDVFFCSTSGKQIVYLNKYLEIGDRHIPISKFWISVRHTRVGFYWDGNFVRNILYEEINHQFLTNLMGENLYSEFQENARSVKVNKEFIPPPEFEPEFLLRVPSKDEIKKLPEEYLEKVTEQLNKPLFLYDTRGAIKLSGSYPIIDSVKDAVSILSRAPNGVALNNDYPSKTILDSYTEDKEYYLACGSIK
jgi:hypothetical protein